MLKKQQSKTKKRACPAEGIAHINCSFNNTKVSITTNSGDVVAWSTTGKNEFKGSRKSTPHAARVTADDAGSIAKDNGMQVVEIKIKGPGPGREMAIKAIGNLFKVTAINDVTPVAHNGTRPPKERRV